MYQGEKRLCNSHFGICIFLKCPIYTVETTAEGGDRAQSRLLEIQYYSTAKSVGFRKLVVGAGFPPCRVEFKL